LKLTDSVASQAGAMVINELTPNKRVSTFTASFKLRIGNGSAEPADGFNFSFGDELPAAAATAYGENGAGSGLSFVVDNYRFLPFYVGAPMGTPGGGTANTSGMKLQYNGIILTGVQIPQWNADRYVPVSITVTPDGVATVLVDGTNAFGNVVLPGYEAKRGRFGFFARTGGSTQAQWVDDVSITVLTSDTTLDGGMYGSAYVAATGGVDGSGALHLTDNKNSQAGSFVLNQLTPGAAVKSFNASFKLRIGDGTADAADGFSFNLAGDLPSAATGATGAEEGLGTGLSLSVDNYPGTGSADSPSFKLKWGGTLVAPALLIPKWNRPNWVPVVINLDADGLLDVTVDGATVVQDVPLPYVPVVGRFGFFARTGGQNETHWLDDISINVTTIYGDTASYSQDFNNTDPGTVKLVGGVVTYTPPFNQCGTDRFYYVVSDGQLNGEVLNEVTVNLTEATVTPPQIKVCATNVTIGADATCQALVPDMLSQIVAIDNCCCLTITQDPPAGTPVALGDHVVTFTVTDSAGLTATCTATLTVADVTPPVLVACAPAHTLVADLTGQAVVPNLVVLASATEECSMPVIITQDPPAGALVPAGVTNVTLIATDAANNAGTCQVKLTVVFPVGIGADGTGGLFLTWPATMPPVVVQSADNMRDNPIVWTDLSPQPIPEAQPDGSFRVPLPVNPTDPQKYFRVRGQ
jgi:hypothetical protein